MHFTEHFSHLFKYCHEQFAKIECKSTTQLKHLIHFHTKKEESAANAKRGE